MMSRGSEASSWDIYLKSRNRRSLRKIRRGWKQYKHKRKPKTMQSWLKRCIGLRCLTSRSKRLRQYVNHFRLNTPEKTL